MKVNENKPALFKVNDLKTYNDWFTLMEGYGHIAFYIDGKYYWLYPEGPHKYGLCYGDDDPYVARCTFNSEDEFIYAPMFSGKCVLERADDIWAWEQPFTRISSRLAHRFAARQPHRSWRR